MKNKKEIVAGGITIVALALLYWGFNFLKGSDVLKSKREFYSVYNRVDNLTKARPVMINGHSVGQVDEIEFHPDGSGRLVVKFSVTSDFPFSNQTVAQISSQGLLGEKLIELNLKPGPRRAQSGDTLPSNVQMSLSEEVNQQVLPLKQKAEKLIGSIDTAMTLVTGFLGEDTRNNFLRSFESMRRSFITLEHTINVLDQTLTENSDRITVTLSNMESVSQNLKDNNENVDNILSNLSGFSDSIAASDIRQTMRKLNSVAQKTDRIVSRVERGEGTLGKLVADEGLYDNLDEATAQLNKLLVDMKYNPNRYLNFSVFGRKAPYSDKEIERALEKEKEEKQEREEESK